MHYIRINTDKAPKAIGPYSQAVKVLNVENFIFTSGQIAINPQTNEFFDGNIKEQATRVFENLDAILEEGGTNLSRVIKTTVYLTDIVNDFAGMNEICELYLPHKPARSTIEVSRLPKNAKIEIEVIAYKIELWARQ